MKADIDIVKSIVSRNVNDTKTTSRIIEEIENELKHQREENPPTPSVKKQFVIMVSDPEGKLPETDFTGWVFQIPEEDSPMTTEGRVTRAAYDYNQTPKGRRLPVKTIGEACEAVGAKYLKEQEVWVKTKEPVLVVRTDNQIPFSKLENQ